VVATDGRPAPYQVRSIRHEAAGRHL